MHKRLSVLVALSFAAVAASATPAPAATSGVRDAAAQMSAVPERYESPADNTVAPKTPAAVPESKLPVSEQARPQEQVAWRFLRRFFYRA